MPDVITAYSYMPEQTLTITLYAQGDAIATAAVIKLLLDWLLPLGLVYETALLPPHMRYSRISEPTREVFRIPHAGVPMGPTCQWQHRSSGRRGCNQPRCSRASATPDQALEGDSSTAAATPPAQDPRGPPSQSHSQPPP